MLKRSMNYLFIVFISISLPTLALATTPPTTKNASTSATTSPANQNFVDNKDYQTLPNNPSMLKPVNGQVTVMEFFSVGCPWCFRFEPVLEKWLATKPAHISFERIPVVYEQGWDVYAKSYYVAKELGVDNKMIPALFDAIQNKQMDLTNVTAMQQFFVQHGVKQDDFQNTYQFSPGIDAQMAKGNQLMNDYLVYSIPTLVVDGKYKVDTSMTGGDANKMIQVVEFLVNKELNQKS